MKRVIRITMDDFEFLKQLALIGIEWEIKNSIGVDDPKAQEHYRLMLRYKKKILADLNL